MVIWGEGFTPNGFGWLNDLWKYNPATNEWTWVKGDKVYELGIYGIQGIPRIETNQEEDILQEAGLMPKENFG